MTRSGTRWTSGRRRARRRADGEVLDAKVEKPWYYQGGDDVLIAHLAGKSSPIFRAQVAFPLRESADYAIIGLLPEIVCFGGNA